MFPASVFPKSMGPPPRDPLPTWVTPASRRTAEDVSFHYRGFTWKSEFRVPRGEASMMAQRVIQNDQAMQMNTLQIQERQCQLGMFQTQNQFPRIGVMSQFANLLHSGCQPWFLPGLQFNFSHSSGTYYITSCTCSDWLGIDLRTTAETNSQWECSWVFKIGTWPGPPGQFWYDSTSDWNVRTSVANPALSEWCSARNSSRNTREIGVFRNWTTCTTVHLT